MNENDLINNKLTLIKYSTMNNPKITVVTVCFNAVKEIERTMLSVINQSYGNIEYIIVDGGSKDGTVDVIRKFEDRITKWISETDKGIYDAMNKGIMMATGEWINFMNAGDYFADFDVVKTVAIDASKDNFDVIYGDVIHRHSFGKRKVYSSPLTKLRKSMVFSHQSCFVNIYGNESPLFETKYRYAADYKMLLSLFLKGKNYHYIPIIIASVSVDEGVTSNNFKKSKSEAKEIQISEGIPVWEAWLNYLYEISLFTISNYAKILLPTKIKKWILEHKS